MKWSSITAKCQDVTAGEMDVQFTHNVVHIEAPPMRVQSWRY